MVMLAETWYLDDSDVISIEGYDPVYINRKIRAGGGVCIYLKHEMRCEFPNEWSQCPDDIEVVSVKVENFVFVAVYRPPDGNINNGMQFLDNMFSFVNGHNYKLVLGGDLNVDMLANSDKQKHLSTLLDSHFLSNVIATPTRITQSSATLIDLSVTNLSSESIFAGTISTAISDHLPIFFIAPKSHYQPRQLVSGIYYQPVNSKSLSHFREEIEQTNWVELFSLSSADLAYDNFRRTFSSIYNKHFSLRAFKKPKRARKPWMTTEILKMMKEKDRLFHVFLGTRNLDDLKMFKKHRNSVI